MATNATMVAADGAWTLQSLNTAIEGRYTAGALLAQANVQSGSITPLITWRSGVLPSASYQGAVMDLSITTSSGLNLTVYPGVCVINRAGQGPYLCYNTTAKTVTVNAGDSTNPRNDIIVARVYDAAIGDAQTGFAIEVVTGTPAASPVDPTLPAGSIPLRRVRVVANASTLSGSNLTDLRTSTTIPGAMRVLLGGDPTAMTGDGYLHGELRFRKAAGSLPDLIDYWGSDGAWHTLNDNMVCRVTLNGNVGLGANSDLFAQGGWSATEDPYVMFNGAPGAGTYSYIQVPAAGKYLVSYRSVMDSSSGAVLVAVNKNSTASGNSVARDSRAAVTSGGDGSWAHATREVTLAVNDKLYWENWASVSCNIKASAFGTPTEMYVRRVG